MKPLYEIPSCISPCNSQDVRIVCFLATSSDLSFKDAALILFQRYNIRNLELHLHNAAVMQLLNLHQDTSISLFQHGNVVGESCVDNAELVGNGRSTRA